MKSLNIEYVFSGEEFDKWSRFAIKDFKASEGMNHHQNKNSPESRLRGILAELAVYEYAKANPYEFGIPAMADKSEINTYPQGMNERDLKIVSETRNYSDSSVGDVSLQFRSEDGKIYSKEWEVKSCKPHDIGAQLKYSEYKDYNKKKRAGVVWATVELNYPAKTGKVVIYFMASMNDIASWELRYNSFTKWAKNLKDSYLCKTAPKWCDDERFPKERPASLQRLFDERDAEKRNKQLERQHKRQDKQAERAAKEAESLKQAVIETTRRNIAYFQDRGMALPPDVLKLAREHGLL